MTSSSVYSISIQLLTCPYYVPLSGEKIKAELLKDSLKDKVSDQPGFKGLENSSPSSKTLASSSSNLIQLNSAGTILVLK